MKRPLLGLAIFAVSFAFVESSTVIYLRMIYEPVRAKYYPGQPTGELFPVLTLDQINAEGTVHQQRLYLELAREFATIVLLAGAATMIARNFATWLAAFMIAFGIWDIFYYVWLWVCAGWPSSLMQWDILFLLPTLWAGPVITPVIVSVVMVLAGLIVFWWEGRGNRYRPPFWSYAGIFAGAIVIVIAFCWDAPHLLAGNMPRSFPWSLFLGGLILGFGSFLAAFPTMRTRTEPKLQPA